MKSKCINVAPVKMPKNAIAATVIDKNELIPIIEIITPAKILANWTKNLIIGVIASAIPLNICPIID